MVGLHFGALLALLCGLLHYVVFVAGGPGLNGFARFFHTASGLLVTAVNFFLLFPASLCIQFVQVLYLVFLLRVSLLVRLLVPDLLYFFRVQPLLSVAVRELRGTEVVQQSPSLVPVAAFFLVQIESVAAQPALAKPFFSGFVEDQQRSVRFRGG